MQDLHKCVDASPLIGFGTRNPGLNGVVFIGSHSHKFVAVSLQSGDTLWEVRFLLLGHLTYTNLNHLRVHVHLSLLLREG